MRWVQLWGSWAFFELLFFGIGIKTDLFQSCGHCWVFQICGHIECSTFTASSFRIWNSSTGIPSPPLALFVVMLSKAHLTSHSRDQIANIRWIMEKAIEFQKNIYFCFIDYAKPLTVWITTNCGKFWKTWEYPTIWPASWEICMQVKKQQLELDMEQQTGSK